jgi:tetratricopeptide (TPR) repeat protein
MNVTEYTALINTPTALNSSQSDTLENIVQEFPYFQSARALLLKGLYSQNSFKYNVSLKITAAHTTDRSVLFDFITSETFSTTAKPFGNSESDKNIDIQNEEPKNSALTEQKLEQKPNTLEESILISIKSASPITEDENLISIEDSISEISETKEEEEAKPEKLDLGKPLIFSINEKHSFQEWLQLSALKPIQREESNNETENVSEIDSDKKKKNDLIDKFIEASPKIPPVKQDTTIPSVFFEASNADHSYLMTETLARVYLEQKKYQKAIQAYEILILKYPEKSSFFADRILDIKNLQQNNK